MIKIFCMKKIIYFLIVFSLYSCGVEKATPKDVNTAKKISVYKTTSDFLNKNAIEVNVVFNTEDKQYFSVSKMFDSHGIVLKKWNTFWAFKYKNNIYFNLLYSKDNQHNNKFVKLDVIGNKCLVLIDKNSPKFLKNIEYPFGLSSALAIGNIYWKDKQANKNIILIIETDIFAPSFGRRPSGSFAYFLNKGRMKDLIKKYNIKNIKVANLSFEDAVTLIKQINDLK